MTYGAETVLPLETSFPTLKSSTFTPRNNDELLGRSLNLAKEKRERAMIQLAYYHQKLKQGYDTNVTLRPLGPGDLMMRRILAVPRTLPGVSWDPTGKDHIASP